MLLVNHSPPHKLLPLVSQLARKRLQQDRDYEQNSEY